MMSCPYSEMELEKWDSVCNPMGEACSSCEEFDCDHNDNFDNPNLWTEGSGEPYTSEKFIEDNQPKVRP